MSVTIVAPDFVQSEIHQRSLGSDGKPLGQCLQDYGKYLSAEVRAGIIVKGTVKWKRFIVTSWCERWGQWVKLLSPRVIDWMAKRSVEEAYRQ